MVPDPKVINIGDGCSIEWAHVILAGVFYHFISSLQNGVHWFEKDEDGSEGKWFESGEGAKKKKTTKAQRQLMQSRDINYVRFNMLSEQKVSRNSHLVSLS